MPAEIVVADVTPNDVAKPTGLVVVADVSDAPLDVTPDAVPDVADVPPDAPDVAADCASDNDCVSTPMTPTCDTTIRRYVACKASNDRCARGPFCDPMSQGGRGLGVPQQLRNADFVGTEPWERARVARTWMDLRASNARYFVGAW